MIGSWNVARRNLLRNKRRNIATSAAIALGFAALIALGGYIHHVESYLRAYTLYAGRVGHINIYKKNGFALFSAKPKIYSLDPDDQKIIYKSIEELKDIDLTGSQLQGSGLIGNGCKTLPFVAIGIDPALERALRTHPQLKKWAPSVVGYSKGGFLDDYPESLGGIVLAEGLAQLIHKPKVHNEFPPNQKVSLVTDCLASNANQLIEQDANVQLVAGAWSGMLGALDGEIIAQYRTGLTEMENTAIVLSVQQLQKLFDTQNVTNISLWLKKTEDLPFTLESLQKKFKEAGKEFEILPWTDENLNPMYMGTMQFLYTLVSFIAVVLSTIVVLSIFNAATMTVIERSQEIGMMRSLGFTRGQIKILFIKEMILLALLAIIAGSIIACIGILVVNNARIELNPPGIAGGMFLQLIPNIIVVLGSFILTFVLAILTTLVAVRKIVKQPITYLLMGSNR